jgi:uncharacterized protein (DUF952 family)
MAIILHIATREAWRTAKRQGFYEPLSFKSEGFIHCSRPEQVIQVANSLFRGQTDLVLLVINTAEVAAEIRYENLEGGQQLFPHIYGILPLAAVKEEIGFAPQADGTFALPRQLARESDSS